MRVAVIGAGAAGLVTARELRREGLEVEMFEHSAQIGGTWVADESPPGDPLGRDRSRLRPTGALYPSLRTNLPRDVMAFGDLPFEPAPDGGGDPRRFPGHAEVRRYLEAFARRFGLHRVLRSETTVTRVRPGQASEAPWDPSVATEPTSFAVTSSAAGQTTTEPFDAVAICNGHYAVPQIPALPGLDRFGGPVLHSVAYRDPSRFAGQTVALLGARSSGIDLSIELSSVATRVILCGRDLPRRDGGGERGNLQHRPAIIAVDHHRLHLADGSTEDDVDALILCTGYRYALPMLDPADGLLTDRERVFPLYLDLVCARAQRVALVGLPLQVVPFPLFEIQARLWARVLSGRVELPPATIRLAQAYLREARMAAAGVPRRHRLRYGAAQFRYCAGLAALAGDPPPPAWREQLYTLVGQARRRDPAGYRDAPLPTVAELGDRQ